MAELSKRHLYIVILCGGTGPRLWPLSTANNPKQFLKIGSNLTILQETIKRCLSVVSSEYLYIISNRKYANKLKGLPGTLILEPDKKNTTTAILYASSYIYKKDPNAIVATTPSDLSIQNIKLFQKDINAASLAAKKGSIITIGIKPSSANPSFGYIKTSGQHSPYRVLKFIEKPTITRAKRLIQNPAWYWNSGMYIFSLSTLKHTLYVHHQIYSQLYEQMCHLKNGQGILKIYQKSPGGSFDRVISEKSHNLELIPAHFSWADIGEYKAIFKHLPKNDQNNALLNNQTKLISLSSTHCLISGQKNKLVGLVGVKNIAVIDTPQGLLICRLPLSSKVRDLVATMVSDPKTLHFFES